MKKLLNRLFGHSVSPANQRRQSGSARAAIEPLESRQLLSLTFTLALPDGGKTVDLTSVGQQVNMDIWAVVTGTNSTGADDGFQMALGSFLSAATSGEGAASGNLSATYLYPFDAAGAQPGKVQDLNGDGNLDVGANDRSSSGDFFCVRTGSMTTAGKTSFSSNWFKVGTLTYTVTALHDGTTAINFRSAPPNMGIWQEDGNGIASDENGAIFAAGAPVVLRYGTPQPPVDPNPIQTGIDPGPAPTTPGFTPTVSFSRGFLTVKGTASNDMITLNRKGARLVLTVNGQTQAFLNKAVKKISIYGLDGADRITVGKGVIATGIDGGAGNDVITGGDGNDTITGGTGVDIIKAGAGDDVIYAKDGARDRLDGGAGFNRVLIDKVDVRTHIQQLLKTMLKKRRR